MLTRKASSRLGPTIPLVLARASVWQEPHLATNACLPRIRLGSSVFSLAAEQALVASAIASSRPPADARRRSPRPSRGWQDAGEADGKLMSGRNTIRRRGLLGGRFSSASPAAQG